MDFAAGDVAGGDTPGDWTEENTLSPSSISPEESSILSTLSVDAGQEYAILTGVAANMRSGFVLLNASEEVAYSNPSAKRLLKLNSRELPDSPIFDIRKQLIALAADPNVAQTELDRVWLHPEQESSTDLALADAAVRWLRVQSFPVRDVPGKLLGRGVLLDDITLERTAISTRSETLAMAAHELKTPLAIIKGCATTLLGNSARWEAALQREMLQMIDTQADRLHDVLNTLLDVWRLDAGAQNLRLTQVHMAAFLEQLVERWRELAPGHSFLLHLPAENPIVLCDATRLEQAIHHLLNNAVMYSPIGSTIKIVLEMNDSEVRLSITDEGRGIAPEHLDRIFDRFYRIWQGGDAVGESMAGVVREIGGREEEGANGSGLGLAVARATIEAHGGKIWADSAGPGQGATFYFTVPFAPQVTSLRQHSSDAVLSSESGRLVGSRTGLFKQTARLNVLIAENDARMIRYLRAHLEEQQYRVQTVSHGIQFLRQLDLEEPDVIMLGTRLADMSGIELLQRLREFSRTPVMMLLNSGDECDEDERARLFDLGADELVMKPFSMKELLARMRALLRRQPTPLEQPVTQAVFTTGDLMIDYAQHLVLVQGRTVQLSRTEYKLLATLAQNVGMVMTHELLLERVWGAEYNREVDFIWVYISRLRRKIEADPRHPRYILTVPDVGYKLAKL